MVSLIKFLPYASRVHNMFSLQPTTFCLIVCSTSPLKHCCLIPKQVCMGNYPALIALFSLGKVHTHWLGLSTYIHAFRLLEVVVRHVLQLCMHPHYPSSIHYRCQCRHISGLLRLTHMRPHPQLPEEPLPGKIFFRGRVSWHQWALTAIA